MKKSKFIEKIVDNNSIPKNQFESTLKIILDTIMETVASGETVNFPGFGVFKPQHRKARRARHPQTGADIIVPAAVVPQFKPSKGFKDVMLSGIVSELEPEEA